MKILKSLVLFLFIPFFLQALTLRDKLSQASKGDFIVTEQAKSYSVLSIHTNSQDKIILEEITVPVEKIDLSKISWKDWLKNKAPGNTSWILYEIEPKEGKLKECYSWTKEEWLYIDDSEYFFSKLMTLSLARTPNELRKRIGPPPEEGAADRRSLWQPSLIFEGKKVEKARFDVYRAKWPKDKTPLSQLEVELYFRADTPSFPFPYWIEVKHGHYEFKIRGVDSGSGLRSPIAGIPAKPAGQIATQ